MNENRIVDAIENRLGTTGSPRQVRDAIETELLETFNTPAAKAAETADRVHNRVVREIGRRRDEKEATGEIAIVHLRGAGDELLYGSSFVFADDSPDIKASKVGRTFAENIFGCIKTFTFAQFELFGRSVLQELGCHISKVTPHGGDQGIDFYGELTVGNLLKADPAILKLMHDTKMIVVGQAKHYPNRAIGPATVRELVGALSLARTGTFSKSELDLLDGVHLQPFSPLLAMLFTTGDFTRGARLLAAQAGLIVFSGWQLSVFLADKGIGLIKHHDHVEFDKSKFEEWLG